MNKLNTCLIGIGSGGCNITKNITSSIFAEKILFENEIQLQKALKYDEVYIIVSLGGKFGSEAVVEVARELKKLNKLVYVFATKPLAFEGKQRTIFSNESIKNLQLLKLKYIEIIDNNQMLKDTDENISIQNAFSKIDKEIERSILSISKEG